MKVLLRSRDLSEEYCRFASQVGLDVFDIYDPNVVPGFEEKG